MFVLIPGALVVFLAFHGGGFFPGATAFVAAGLALLLVLRITLTESPWAGLTPLFVAAASLLCVFALWTLLSSSWSNAPARALLEYDRALLYLLVFIVFGAAGSTPAGLRRMTYGLLLGILVVCTCGLVTRIAPDVWAVSTVVAPGRLSYPLTYPNAMGLVAALGIVLGLAVTSDAHASRAARVLAAAALPVLAATLLLTFSRGAIATLPLGLLALVLVGRPTALLSGLLVAVPSCALAATSAYGANLLGTDDPTTTAAAAQGHRVAVVVALCAVGAALARAALLRLDGRLPPLRVPDRLRRPAVALPLCAAVAMAAVGIALAFGAWGAVERQYELFVERDKLIHVEGRSRLTDPGNNGRLNFWEVALETFREDRLLGQGAGTYALAWDSRRSLLQQAEDGHSLYLEVLAELGVSGLALLAGVILLVLWGLLARARAPDRVAAAGLFAAGVTWATHAGIDWDWEMPAVTLWFFAAGGMALAASPPTAHRGGMPRMGRVAAALCCLILALVPARILLSDGHLSDSRDAFAAGDCRRAIDRALDSLAVLDTRPEPYAILGYCDVRLGLARLGVRALDNAVARDPDNWEFNYGLALVRAAAGLDPRAAARRAQLLNPREPLARDAVTNFASDDPRVWRARALSSALPTE
jgi:hypothetical protein